MVAASRPPGRNVLLFGGFCFSVGDQKRVPQPGPSTCGRGPLAVLAALAVVRGLTALCFTEWRLAHLQADAALRYYQGGLAVSQKLALAASTMRGPNQPAFPASSDRTASRTPW